MSERDEFEAWARKRGHPLCDIIPKYGPTSSRPETTMRFSDIAWEAWQAARTTPPQAVPALTDQQILDLWQALNNAAFRTGADRETPIIVLFARAILAAPQPSPEPEQPEHWQSHDRGLVSRVERGDPDNCGHCHTCAPITMENMRMIVCKKCGNKRCPQANDHRNACTGSNEPGQPGSAYPKYQD